VRRAVVRVGVCVALNACEELYSSPTFARRFAVSLRYACNRAQLLVRRTKRSDRRKRAKSKSGHPVVEAQKALNTDGLLCQRARPPQRYALGRKNGLRNWQSTACAGVALQVQTKGGSPMGPTEMRKVL